MAQYTLQATPNGAIANKIDVAAVNLNSRSVLRIVLDAQSRAGKPGVDFVDQPSFLLLADEFEDGVIEVDLYARLLPDAPDYARGFIGLAYRVQDDLLSYESIYIRPTNGFRHAPGAPRDTRAVQYYAYPDWPFDVLREQEPDRFEAGADIGLNHWARLRIESDGHNFTAFVDDAPVLSGESKIAPQKGKIGLWVDIGTEGFFANLSVQTTAK